MELAQLLCGDASKRGYKCACQIRRQRKRAKNVCVVVVGGREKQQSKSGKGAQITSVKIET
jgi:hypothetical protein